jgi:ribosomal-protein-alanine N-acetyltransferase
MSLAKVVDQNESLMKIVLSRGFSISNIRKGDEPAYISHLKEKQIHDQTLSIPYPYTKADADWWVNHNLELESKHGDSFSWAIRQSDGSLIGGIGFAEYVPGQSHKAELGYWLAKPFWGTGIMSEAVQRVTAHAFERLNLNRVTAHVFTSNQGSIRVLEKSGYRREGHLRQHYFKNGLFQDGFLYARLASDAKAQPS